MSASKNPEVRGDKPQTKGIKILFHPIRLSFMKTTSIARFMACAALVCSAVSFPSCSSMEEPGTGVYIRMDVKVECPDSIALPDNALSSDSPFRVVAYVRNKKCEPFYYTFKADAFADSNGQLRWIGSRHEWPGEYMKFVAYWPADSNVKLDHDGNVLYSDCVLLAITEPVSHEYEGV